MSDIDVTQKPAGRDHQDTVPEQAQLMGLPGTVGAEPYVHHHILPPVHVSSLLLGRSETASDRSTCFLTVGQGTVVGEEMDVEGGPKRSRRDVALLAVVAIAVRAIYFAGRAHADSFQLPIVDAELFDKAARAFAAGRPTTPDDWFFHGVGYPTILGLLYSVFDSSVLIAKAVQLGFGVLTPILTYFVARDVFDRRTALVAGIVVAVYTPLVFLEGELLDAGWTALFAIALIFTNLKVIRSRRWPWSLAWGALAGAAILVRATFLPYCLLALVFMTVDAVRTERPYRWRTDHRRRRRPRGRPLLRRLRSPDAVRPLHRPAIFRGSQSLPRQQRRPMPHAGASPRSRLGPDGTAASQRRRRRHLERE